MVEAFFRPSPPGAVPAPVVAASPARRLRDAIEPIAMHSVWSRRTNERLHDLGLDFLGGYVWGRAAALGEPDAGVVVSSFAVFEPGMLTATYEQARATCPRDVLLATRTEATIESLHETLAGCRRRPDRRPARRSGRVAADAAGRPLFAGLARQAWPDDPVGRLWRACELAREHRGDSHVAACIADGWAPIAMNVLTEVWVGMPLGSYSATRGWSAEQIATTAAACAPPDCSTATCCRMPVAPGATRWRPPPTPWSSRSSTPSAPTPTTVTAQLDEWSQRCVAAGSFPPDPFKRAAG